MSDDLTPEQKFAQDPTLIVARGLLLGVPREKLVADLLELEYTQSNAERFIDSVAHDLNVFRHFPERRAALRAQARRDVLLSSVLFACSIVGALVVLAAALLFRFFSIPLALGLGVAAFLPGVRISRALSRLWTYRYLEQVLEEKRE